MCGVTTHTRLSGCSFLYPSVLPRPHVTSVRLIPEDELLVLGSCALAQYLSPSEAVQAARLVGDPLAAAKRLATLAQGYGCHENLAVIVIRINPPRFDEDDAVVCCTCEANAVGSGGTDSGAAAGYVKQRLLPDFGVFLNHAMIELPCNLLFFNLSDNNMHLICS